MSFGFTEINVRTSDLMDALSIEDFVDHFGETEIINYLNPQDVVYVLGAEKLLDEIGEDEAIKHFGLELKDE